MHCKRGLERGDKFGYDANPPHHGEPLLKARGPHGNELQI